MVKKEELCPDAQRLLCEGVPLRALGDGTRYFLYPMNKTDYNIVINAVKQLREAMSKMSYQNAQIKLNQFVHTLFEVVQGKLHNKQALTGSYQCFCHKNFKTIAYAPHKTIRDSWNCMLIAYNNPTHCIVLSHNVDEDGNRIWG